MIRAAALGLALAGCVTLRLPGQSFQGAPPPPPPELVEALRRDVEQLAGSIGPRSFQRPAALVEAREYIEARLTAAGLPPQRERYTIADPRTRWQTFTNIYAENHGTSRPEELVVGGPTTTPRPTPWGGVRRGPARPRGPTTTPPAWRRCWPSRSGSPPPTAPSGWWPSSMRSHPGSRPRTWAA